jgi:ferrous iron transport protein B
LSKCASTLAVVKRETNSWKWPAIMFAYMIALAYAAAFIIYRIALALGLADQSGALSPNSSAS